MKRFAYNVAFFSGKVVYGFLDAWDQECALLHVEQTAFEHETFDDQVVALQVVEA